MDLNVKDKKDEIGEIALRASKEEELTRMFETVRNELKSARFTVVPYKDKNKDIYIFGSMEEITELLEESQGTMTQIISARFNDHILDDAKKQAKQLNFFEELLDEWNNC